MNPYDTDYHVQQINTSIKNLIESAERASTNEQRRMMLGQVRELRIKAREIMSGIHLSSKVVDNG